MLFKPELAAKILRGEKTETRRLKKPGDRLVNGRTVYRNGRVQWELGRTYAICPGRGKRAVGRIRLTCISEEIVGAIREECAIQEGFRSRDEFLAVFAAINGAKHESSLCYALTFELVNR